MNDLTITVIGTPAPQGSKRAFVNKANGRVQMVESSKAVKPWREAVKAAVFEQPGVPAVQTGPVAVEMTFTLPKPASAPKTRQTWPSKRPDLSKLARSTEDALTDAGVWKDDAQVTEMKLAKRYPNEGEGALDRPGALIVIRRVQ